MNTLRILVVAASLLGTACSGPDPERGAQPVCQLPAEVASVESALLMDARGHDSTGLVVAGGTIRQRDDVLILDAYEKGYSPFFGLVSIDGGAVGGIEEWLGRKVSIRGCYTSGDVQRPEVRGAVGMIHVEQIGPPAPVPQ